MSTTGKGAALSDASASGVFRVADAEALASAARAAGLDTVRISLERVEAKPALLEAIAAALQFPDWFGANWDALEDCLTDLSWRGAAGHVLVFEGGGWARRLPASERDMLLEVLASSARFWAAQGAPFFAVFVDPARTLDLPEVPPGLCG